MIRRTLPWPADIAAAVGVFGGSDEMAWLDASGPGAGISAIARRPTAAIGGSLAGSLRVSGEHNHGSLVPPTWDHLLGVLRRRVAGRQPAVAADRTPPAIGPGWLGFLGYEFGQSERVAPWPADDGCDVVRLAYYDQVLALDHATREAWLLADDSVAEHQINEAAHDWQIACERAAVPTGVEELRLRSAADPAAHAVRVQRILDYIAAGDVYQVNLAQAFEIEGVHDPLSFHRRVRQTSPARYGAFIRWSDGAVSSISPELFLQVRGRDILTRPIKGTRPRVGVKATDDAQTAALLASAKDAAELAMIVDLHRNDLGRVAQSGSVRVVSARRLETHPTVFHTVADVTARLADGRDSLDALQAAFPAGSITGAPKLRAMQIIRELEPAPRGVFSGAIGHIGADGDITLNVAIRTAYIRDGVATIHAGGGIVADSEPHAEYNETLAKAAAFFRAAGVTLPAAR